MGKIIKSFEKNGLWIYIINNGKGVRGQDDFQIKLEGQINADDFEEVTDFLQKLKERLYENQDQGYELDYRLDELY